MKSIVRALIAAVFLLATANFSSADTSTAQTILTSFDFDIVGVGLKAAPEYQAVPKGIASKVNASFEAAGFNLKDLVAQLPKDYTVRAELSGPAFQTPIPLVTKAGVPFDLPTLAVTGRYTLANIRLVDGNGTTLFGAVPQVVAIESIPDPLITSVTTRQLTVQDLQDRGVTFDKSNFTAYEFTAGIATSSGQVPLTLPVIIPTGQVVQTTPTIEAPSTISLPQPSTLAIPPDVPQAALPQNLEVKPFMMEVQETEKVGKIQLPPIPGVVVIPGNIGFLHQYFSAMALVSNGAPLQSGLSIRDVQAVISFPVGEDLTPGTDAQPGDDPLRMARGQNGYFSRTMGVMNAGTDDKAGTADDVSSMLPGESGQADFTIEGLKEGTHKVDFAISAILDGLPIGPVTLKGKATGAVLVRNPDFAVTLGHPATVRAGEEYDLFVTVSNTGNSTANLVSVGLDPRALSGAAFVAGEPNSKSIDTIQPASAATVKFRLKSQRTGKVTATAFESPDLRGRFILRAGVGENNIPLSPDSLILPYTGNLPTDLITSAVGLLGQAWSVATAPTGALPATVLPVSKQTVTSRAYDLSEAGLRILIGDDQVKAAIDLTFDFFGSDVYNTGFDSLRRSSTMGIELNRALGGIFKTGIDANGVIAFQAGLADKVSSRPGHLSIVSGNAPLRLRLTDASGNRSAALTANESNRTIPYSDSIVVSEEGGRRTNLILATRLDSPSYSLGLAAEDAATFDLGVVLPDAAGGLTQYVFAGISLSAGAAGNLTLVPGSGNLSLSVDDNGDGAADRTLAPSSVIPVTDHAPHIVAATQFTPDFGPGGDRHGRNVAVLFSERVTKESAQNPANYGVDENLVKQAALQPGNRMAFLLLGAGIGPFFERNLTAQGLVDQAGKGMSQPETLPIRITAMGPAAVVTGTVRTARGEPVPNATIRLYQLIWYPDPLTGIPEERYALFTKKLGNADGSYSFEYVLQNDDPAGPFQIEVVNPLTNEAGSLTTGVMFHGQRLQLDIFMKSKGSLSGLVQNESGNPVGGAAIQVITLADNRGQSKTTDASGAFSFSDLMVGAYSLKAVSQAVLSEGSAMGTLPEDGRAVTQDVTIRRVADFVRGTVVGKVLGADGVTPRGGVIAIIDGPDYQNWQRTSADGSFSFSGVFAGLITVTARDDSTGEQSESGGIISASGQIVTLNVILRGTGMVTGLVTRDDGKSSEGLYVVARPSQGQPRVLLTDAIGVFRVEYLPIGNVGIEVIDPRDFNRTVASGTVTILAAGDTANIALFVPLKAMAVGTIQGTVYHRDGSVWPNAPIKRVVDAWHYYVHQADGNGTFTLPNLSLGGYTLTVTAGNEVINASTDLWYDTQVRTLELRTVGLGTVTGTTWDDAAKTMPTGADVTMYSTKPNLVGVLSYDTDNPTVVKSDPQTGRFSFGGVLQGSFTVTSSNIFRPTPVSAGGKIEAHGQVVSVDLSLKGSPPKPGEPPPVNQPGSVSGQVLMPDGSKAGKDVRVTLTFGGADVTVITDELGLFHFAPIIPTGSQPIVAEDLATTLKWKGSVYVPSGLDVPITIRLLGRGSLTVKVLNADGTTAQGASVNVRGSSYPNDSASGVTDAAGLVSFANLSEGSYALSATGSFGRGGRSQAFIPGDKAVVSAEVRLAPSATVTGRFLKADGLTPIAAGQITLKRNGQVIAYASSASDTADPGRYRMEFVPLGDFTVEGYDPVTERRGIGGGRLNSDSVVVVADVVVTPRGTVKGMVLNYGGTAPISGAPVSISVSGVTGFNFSSVTAPDGNFYFSGVPAGRFTVDSADPVTGLHGQTTGTLSYENETVTVQVHTAPTGSIAGRVLMPDGVTPVTTATVRLNGGYPQQVDSATAAFRYDNLAAGRSYSLATAQPNTRRTGSTVATINHDLEVANGDIILGGVGTVSGVVHDSDGNAPLSGAKVELRFSGGTLTDYTAGDGSFSFSDIPTGSFTVTASHTLRITGASLSGYLQNEGQLAALTLVLGPVASVKATVLLADGVTPSRGGGIRINTNTGRILTGITDSSGQYTFSNIPIPCTISLYVEDAAGIGIGRAIGVLDHNGQVLELDTIVLDDKPIFVTSVNPPSGAVNVPISQTMRVIFSEPADPSTLNSSNIYLTQGANRVAGTLQNDADNSGVIITPTEALNGFTLYTLVVTDSVTDRVARKLALQQSVSFSTLDNIPPVLSSVSPAEGTLQVAADAVVRLTFSEAVDPASLGGITLSTGGMAVAVRSDLIQNGTVVALTPLEPLAYNRSYTVSVNGVRDMVDNVLSGTLQATFATVDTISPAVSAVTVPPSADLIKGNTIPVSAVATDIDVASIDFYLDDQRLGSVAKSPYSLQLTLTKVGVVHLKAIAQDRVGNRGGALSLDLDVKADQPPQVSFISPAEGSSISTGATFSVTVAGTDDLGVMDITLSASGEMGFNQTKSVTVGKTATSTFTLTAPATFTQGGSVVLTAVARDTGGNTSQNVLRTLMLHDSIAPSVSLSSPGQTIKYKPGESASVNVSAGDNTGLVSISCTASGASTASRVFAVDPPQVVTTQTFSVEIPVTATPNSIVAITCAANDAAGNSKSAAMELTIADIVPPLISSSSISDNAINVPTNASITLNFNETLSPPSVTTSNVVLVESVSGAGVPASVTLSADRKAITAKPLSLLLRGVGYTLTVTPAVADDAGNTLVTPYLLHFTSDTTAPVVSSVAPPDGSVNVPVGSAVSARFSEQIDAASVTSDLVSLTSISGPVPGALSVSGDGLSLTFKPYNQLGYSRLYTFTLKTGVRDISGNATAAGLTATFTTQGPDSNLVGYWPMDGDWTDYSGNGNHGTAYNGAAFSSDKIVGTQAGSFDGVNDYVSVPDTDGLSPQSQGKMTISAWVNLRSYPSGGQNRAPIISKGVGENYEFALYVNGDGSTGLNTWQPSGCCAYASSIGGKLLLNNWYNVTAVLDANSTKKVIVYINGDESSSTTSISGASINGPSQVFIGSRPDNAPYQFINALIDDVVMYKRALAPEDVVEHYNAVLTSDGTPPAAPTVEPVESPTFNYQIVLRGTKEAGSSVRVNGKQIVAHDANIIWQAIYQLSVGQNLLDVSSHDLAGNVSPAVNLVVDLLPANPNDPVPSKPVVTLVSPGQSLKYRPGEIGMATVTATDPNGITRLYCVSSGAVSEGTLVVSVEPPQTDVIRLFTFRVASDAAPYAPYSLSCVADTFAGSFGVNNLDLQAADLVPATVTGASIADNATSVVATLPFTVTFNEAMLAASITSDTVQLRRIDTGAVVAGTSVLSADGKTLTFTPTVALECSTSYQFVIRGVSDLAGNVLVNEYVLHFTTQPVTALTIGSKGTSSAPYAVAAGRYSNIQITNSYVVMTGSITADTLSLANSTLTHNQTGTSGAERLDLNVTTLTIDTTSKIDVSGKGYLGGYSGSNSAAISARTVGNSATGGSAERNGGSNGGSGGNSSGSSVNTTYGVFANPNDVGSGGGGYYSGSAYPGGNGGGLIKINATMINLFGSIIADGGSAINGGGGSGGGIRIDVDTLTGSGLISARGGASTAYYSYGGAGGGGGRVALFYNTLNFQTTSINASGGTGQSNGGAGTIYLKEKTTAKGLLAIDNKSIVTNTLSTKLPAVGKGTVGSLTATTLSRLSGTWQAGALKGLKINPNTSQYKTFSIIDNSVNTLTIDPADGDLTLVTTAGSAYSGMFISDDEFLATGKALVTSADPLLLNNKATITGGAVLSADPLTMTAGYELVVDGGSLYSDANGITADTVTVKNGGLITHWETTTTATHKLTLNVNNLTIDGTSKIDVSRKGYLGGYSGGNSNSNTAQTNTSTGGSSDRNGGSYGGSGGKVSSSVNATYGLITNPNDVGSGGGGYTGYDYYYCGCQFYLAGGNGGGFVRITATGTINLAGSILADGGSGSYSGSTNASAGSGSGGGILINTGTLLGKGTISAKGGGMVTYGGGGGGRIAIYFDTNSLPTANVVASGGKAYDGSNSIWNGGAGTIYLKGHGNAKADLIINNGGITTTRSTPIPGGDYRIYDVIGGAVVSPSGPITSENEIVIKDTQVTITGDYTVPRNLTLLNSTVTVSGAATVPGNLLMNNSTLSVKNNLNVTGTITAQSGSIITHEAATSDTQYGLDIKAAGVTIDSTSKIDVKGKGYLGGLRGDNGSDVGRTAGNSADGGSAAGNGGSLGGLGGTVAGVTAASYGSIINPAEPGSGGGGDLVAPASGGNGGGFVKLTTPTLTLNGSIVADGMDSPAGAGSGGSIRMDVTTISGSGSILARGGNGDSAGAGGGRIALYYTSNAILAANINCSGGKAGDGSVVTRNGGAGTVYLKQSAKTYADLFIDNRGLDSAAGSTPLKTAGKGTITVITGSSLIQSNIIWPVSVLKGYWINPNTSQAGFFNILDNSADTMFINPADGNLNSVAVAGDSFSGIFALNSLSVLGKAHLYTDEQFNVAGDASIDNATVVAGELYAGRTLLTNGGLFERR